MKCIIATALLTALPFAAQADEPGVQETCAKYESFAETVMTSRQNGASMSDMMAVVADDSQLLKNIVMESFQHPRYSTERVQQRTIRDYANLVAAECYEALGK